MATSGNADRSPEPRAALCEALVSIGEFRPGSLQARYRTCGKPGCHCAQDGDPGHGPKWVLTRTVDGKRRNFSIPDEAIEATRAQVAEFQRFRCLTHELIEVSERLCQARLTDGGDLRQAGKRGRSKPSSRRRSRPRRTG